MYATIKFVDDLVAVLRDIVPALKPGG